MEREKTQPEFDLLEHVQEQAFRNYNRKLWDSTENILRQYIDNPIEGELTKQKMKDANIMGFIYQNEDFPPKMVQTPDGGFSLTLTSNMLGVRQGDTLIMHNGERMPVSEIPCEWYEERFIYD